MHYCLPARHNIYSWLLPDQPMSGNNCLYHSWVVTSPGIMHGYEIPRPLTSEQKWLPENNTHTIVCVGLAEQLALHIQSESEQRLHIVVAKTIARHGTRVRKGVSTPELDSNRFANRIDRCESKSHSMRIHRVHTTSSTTDEAVSTCMFAHDSHAYTNKGWRYRELH